MFFIHDEDFFSKSRNQILIKLNYVNCDLDGDEALSSPKDHILECSKSNGMKILDLTESH